MLSLIAVALLATLVCGVLIGGEIRRADGRLDDARERRAHAERMERAASRIEVTGWRVWRNEGDFRLDAASALEALALLNQALEFYRERARTAGPPEAAVVREALTLLEEVPALVVAARRPARNSPAVTEALERFPEFAERQERVHTEWLEVNHREIQHHERTLARWTRAAAAALALVISALVLLIGALLARGARQRRELISELRRQATTDDLTGLHNRAEFHRRLDIAAARAAEGGESLALVMIDVDHFKLVNDLHGHVVGDRALAEIARRLSAVARSGDCLARVGGEEFAWILCGADRAETALAAERARRAVGSAPIDVAGVLTVSVGVAELALSTDVALLYRRADMALYRAKRRGRDRVVFHGADPAPAPPLERSAVGA